MSEMLKPCPFCGGKGEIKSVINYPVDGVTMWSATCTCCGAQAALTADNGDKGEMMIARSWNWESKRISAHKGR